MGGLSLEKDRPSPLVCCGYSGDKGRLFEKKIIRFGKERDMASRRAQICSICSNCFVMSQISLATSHVLSCEFQLILFTLSPFIYCIDLGILFSRSNLTLFHLLLMNYHCLLIGCGQWWWLRYLIVLPSYILKLGMLWNYNKLQLIFKR